MGPILKRAIEAARDPVLVNINNTLELFKETIAALQSSCPHPLLIESPWRPGPFNPMRICAKCGLEEHSGSPFGHFQVLCGGDGRDVEEADANAVYALRPPLGATFTARPQ